MTEIWKDVIGYEGLYQVSNLGNVRSLNYRGKKIVNVLKQDISSEWHHRVCLSGKNKLVHRIVAIAFIETPEKYKDIPLKKLDVHHIDKNPHNNSVDNLMWMTKEEHLSHHHSGMHFSKETLELFSKQRKGRKHSDETKRKIGESRSGEKHPMFGLYGKDNPTSKPILQYDLEGNLVAEWDCIKDAATHYNIYSSNISLVCNGKQKTYKGYVWKFKEVA